MANKHTKRALLSSVMALILCFTMLLGTTFAWFTDSVTSKNNTIVAGNLDVELKYKNSLVSDWTAVGSTSDLFDPDALWEPGHVEVVYLEVSNLGSLALKYQLRVNVFGETAGVNVEGKSFKLSDYLVFKVVEVDNETQFAAYEDRDAAITAAGLDMGLKDYNGAVKTLGVDGVDYVALIVYMPETVGNVANYRGTQVPQITLGVDLFATQASVDAEKDSFGSDYDANAPMLSVPVAREDIPAGSTTTLKSTTSDVKVDVSGDLVGNLPTNVTSVGLSAADPVVDATNKTVTIPSLELVDQDGEIIDLTNNTTPVTVTLPVGNAFADGELVEIYHDGVLVASAVVAGGKVTYQVTHFCEVSIGASKADFSMDNLVIDSVEDLIAFASLVNGGEKFQGKTITLAADLDLKNMSWTPIGQIGSFNGTFDGQGHTISNLTVHGAGKSNIGLFGTTENGEIKDLTVENANVTGRLNVGVVAGQPYTSKYTNITVTGHVEVNGLAYVGGVGGKNAYANWDNITVKVDEESYVNAYSIENGNAYRTYVGGVIGFMGEGAHTVSNVTSNIDVIGSTCDVGGIVGIAHYGNTFENITCTGNVTVTNAAEAADAEEMGGIAGVWHNQNGYTVTFTNCTFTGELTANVAADLSNNTIAGAPYGKGNGTLVVDGIAHVTVSNGDQLKAALADNKNVIFVSDITMAATESNAYGKTGINVKNGQTIDGNGYTLKVTGAGATWDSAISTTGGLIKNLTVAQGFRGIFVNHNSTHSETVVLDNVTIQGPTYTISADQGMNQGLVATNCTINGWTSYAATAGEAKFVDCSFGKGAGYAFCRPYSNTEFVNCTFSEGYAIDTTRATVTFTDCENPNK